MALLIEEPHVFGDGYAEVVTEGSLAHDADSRSKGFLQLVAEPAHLEKAHDLPSFDIEVLITVRVVVTAGYGAEQVHSEYSILDGDGSDHLTELLERAPLNLVHGYRMTFALHEQESGPDHLRRSDNHGSGFETIIADST